jgi:hypothetical protein
MKGDAPLSKSPYIPTPDELAAAPSHVVSELRMLRAAASEWVKPTVARPRDEPWRGTALLDSAILHARNMYDFLTRMQPSRDYVVAAHFARDQEGNAWVAKLPYTKSLWEDMHKFRHHLTYSRITLKRQRWLPAELQRVVEEINAAFQAFVRSLPEPERDRWRA